MSISLILSIVAVILLFCEAFHARSPSWVSLGWLGLFFLALSRIVGGHL